MECPKCGLEIDEKTTVCPNCKKVLKVVCPICKTINKTNTCKKCGYVIITKCNKCGKINQTVDKKCKKCGFSLEQSVILNESNTDNFALMTIDFPNVNELRNLLGSVQLLNKFKIKLDKIIFDVAKSAGIRRQVLNNTYILRFDKDYTFNSSVNTAISAAVTLITEMTKLNFKLTNKKNATVRCNMFILRRSIDDNPYDIKSGFNISVVKQSESAKERALNTSQIIVDNYVKESLGAEYSSSPLNSVMLKGEMVMFHEVDISSRIKINYEDLEDKPDEELEVPNFVQNMLVEQDKLDGEALSKLESPTDPDAIYDIETIHFNEIQCEFIRTENIDVFYHMINRLSEHPYGICAIKTAPLYVPYSLKIISTIEELNIYKNIISITCYDEMKYSPYSFFRELVSAIFEFTVSQKLFSSNDFSMFKSIDPDGLIKDLVTLQERGIDETKARHLTYYDLFFTLMNAIPETLIFIENFEKIDASSYEVMKFLFEQFERLKVSYLISYDKSFSLHKDVYSLMSKPYYTEITLKPTSFKRMIEENKEYYRKIMDSFYFHRIAKYSFGSILFLDIAIQYLIESGVYEANDDCIELVNPKTIIIPSSLRKLMKRRLNLLEDDPDAIKFLATCVLMGTRVDQDTIKSLKYDNIDEIISKLSDMGYIYFWNNCMYFPNYTLLLESILSMLNKELLHDVANDMFTKVFVDSMPSPVKAYIYRLLEDYKSEFLEWENLAKINLSLGDYNAYVNCAGKILELLDKNTDEEKQEEIDKYKLDLSENIANNLFAYDPQKSAGIAEHTLSRLEQAGENDRIIELCNKMIQGYLREGKYTHALELTHKILSRLPSASIDPSASDFNKYFFQMSLVHIEILFNVGALDDCIDIGLKVLSFINQSTLELLRPEFFTKEEFEAIVVDAVGFVALACVLQMKGNVKEFLNIVKSDLPQIPPSYDIFPALESFMKGDQSAYSPVMVSDRDRFSGILFHIMEAFHKYSNDSNGFAEEIYAAKRIARFNHLHQLELFCDLMIGKAYYDMESFDKASLIIYKIIKTTGDNGMSDLTYVAWLMMSEMSLRQGRYTVAYGIINNSLIQLEKADGSNEYLLMLFKYQMFKVLMYKQQIEQAKICIVQCSYLTQKYGIQFNFDTDASHYVPMVDPDEEQDNQSNIQVGVGAGKSEDEDESEE